MKLSETRDAYMIALTGAKAKGTVRLYLCVLDRLIKFSGDKEATELTLMDIAAYKAMLAQGGSPGVGRGQGRPMRGAICSSTYIATELSALSSYISFLNRTYGIRAINILDLKTLRPKKAGRKEPTPAKQEEIAAALAAADKWEKRAAIELLYYTGLRVSELVGLTRQNIVWDEIVVDGVMGKRAAFKVLGKGGKERKIPLNQAAFGALNSYLQYLEMKYPRGYTRLFPWTTKTIWRWLQEIARNVALEMSGKRTGQQGVHKDLRGESIKLHPHMFRSAFATNLSKRGADIRVIQELMGHSSIATTQLYTAVDDEQKISAVDKLDKSFASDAATSYLDSAPPFKGET